MSDVNTMVDKIRKLIAQANGTTNENEAMSFMGMAQKLMVKYRIEESVIAQATKQPEVFGVYIYTVEHEKWKNWEMMLFSALSNANSCKSVYIDKTNKVKIYGTENDAQMVYDLYKFVYTQVVRMSNNAFKRSGTNLNGKVWKNNYILGMISKIRQLLKKVTDDVVAESQTFALAIIDKDKAVEQFYEENKGKVTYSKSNYSNADGARRLGYKDGDKVTLGFNPQLNS